MVAQDGLVEPPTIRRWSKTLGELHRRIGHRFARSEASQRVKRYLLGQLPGVGVFVAYSSEKGAAFLDRALYLPRAWTNSPARRTEAGIPEEIVFRKKVELAEQMLQRAFEAEVPAGWVLADSFY
jgi:SRSO17 transposase